MSHFTEVQTKIKCLVTLKKVIEELGYAFKEGETQVRGYQGERVGRDMAQLAEALVNRGADAVVAGCTEIPLVLQQSALEVPLISSTDVLAEATVALARGEQP